ncbi:MAG: PD-(D/E)XK nuclease family protein, partial [Acidobacteria bacterium]|nr:PD-(D/E)XK nuclease family protein [Acidobacteriota bacterium]
PALAGPAGAVPPPAAADDPAHSGAPLALAPPAAIASQAAMLAGLRAAAAARMARPFGAAASEEAHAQLRDSVAEARFGASVGESTGPAGIAAAEAGSEAAAVDLGEIAAGAGIESGRTGSREAAMAAGAAFHRALELWDLAADPVREALRQRALLPGYLSAVASGEEVARALRRGRRLLERFVAGGLAARLRGLGERVVARELPVLLAPGTAAAGGDGAAAAVAFVSGTIDLLYRDPAGGELVIADYKTDEVVGAELERRTAIYASQGAAYVRAVAAALDLGAPPRFELWFVHAGVVVAAAAAA